MSKTVLITGSSRGIGLALARQFHNHGWHVIATCRDPKAIDAEPFQVKLPLAVDDDESIARLAKELSGTPIHLLINNAGILDRDRDELDTISRDSLNAHFNINATSPLLVAKALLPSLLLVRGSLIVNVSSLMGSIGDCGSARHYGYRASKAALDMVTKAMSLEGRLVENESMVVAIHPGFVSTDMTQNRPGGITAVEAASCIYDTIHGLEPSKNGCLLSRLGKVEPW
jgi:NAD(P)-dependent dehydrogenase (short-subunit alcohol dehydrogenase family)